MSSQIQAGLLLYRYQDDGLEVYLVPSDENTLKMPESATVNSPDALEAVKTHFEKVTGLTINVEDLIPLDLVHCVDSGKNFLAYALETDWEKLPKTSKRRRFLDFHKGTYVGVKEAFRRVMPAQYAMLKELQEVLSMRNLLKYL